MTSNKPLPGYDAFHRERSKCIDAFAALEEVVIASLATLGVASHGESFGQKIDLLRKTKASPSYSKTRLERLKALLPKCEALNELRNDLVHSRLQLAVIGEDQRACFTNTRHCLAGSQTARLFTLEGLRALTTEASAVAEAVRNT